jgi:hypothetical protein
MVFQVDHLNLVTLIVYLEEGLNAFWLYGSIPMIPKAPTWLKTKKVGGRGIECIYMKNSNSFSSFLLNSFLQGFIGLEHSQGIKSIKTIKEVEGFAKGLSKFRICSRFVHSKAQWFLQRWVALSMATSKT